MGILGNRIGSAGAGQVGTTTGAGIGMVSQVNQSQFATQSATLSTAAAQSIQSNVALGFGALRHTAVNIPTRHLYDITYLDLKSEAMLAPISVLVNMWLAKYQNEWVLSDDVAKDDFFRLAAARLIRLNKFEAIHITDKWQEAYRLIEDEK